VAGRAGVAEVQEIELTVFGVRCTVDGVRQDKKQKKGKETNLTEN
jgi:hypothetical protein